MKEREGNRKYRVELFSAMVAYMLVLFGSISFAKGMDDGLARTVSIDTAHQRDIQLDRIGLELREQVQTRIPGSEIIDGQAQARSAVGVDAVGEMTHVVDDFALGDFQEQLPHRHGHLFGRSQHRIHCIGQ